MALPAAFRALERAANPHRSQLRWSSPPVGKSGRCIRTSLPGYIPPMNRLSRLRRWINRDDGRLIHVGNAPLGILEILGCMSLLVAMLLHLLRETIGLSGLWATASVILGLVLLGRNAWRERR